MVASFDAFGVGIRFQPIGYEDTVNKIASLPGIVASLNLSQLSQGFRSQFAEIGAEADRFRSSLQNKLSNLGSFESKTDDLKSMCDTYERLTQKVKDNERAEVQRSQSVDKAFNEARRGLFGRNTSLGREADPFRGEGQSNAQRLASERERLSSLRRRLEQERILLRQFAQRVSKARKDLSDQQKRDITDILRRRTASLNRLVERIRAAQRTIQGLERERTRQSDAEARKRIARARAEQREQRNLFRNNDVAIIVESQRLFTPFRLLVSQFSARQNARFNEFVRQQDQAAIDGNADEVERLGRSIGELVAQSGKVRIFFEFFRFGAAILRPALRASITLVSNLTKAVGTFVALPLVAVITELRRLASFGLLGLGFAVRREFQTANSEFEDFERNLVTTGAELEDTSTRFKNAFSEIGEDARFTAERLDGLSDRIRQFAARSLFTAAETQDALKELGRAGFSEDQAFGVSFRDNRRIGSAIEQAANLSLASDGQLDPRQAAIFQTQLEENFGKFENRLSTVNERFQRFNDLLFTAQSLAPNVTLNELQDGLRNTTGAVTEFGVDLESSLAILTSLIRTSQTGPQSGTAVLRLINNLRIGQLQLQRGTSSQLTENVNNLDQALRLSNSSLDQFIRNGQFVTGRLEGIGNAARFVEDAAGTSGAAVIGLLTAISRSNRENPAAFAAGLQALQVAGVARGSRIASLLGQDATDLVETFQALQEASGVTEARVKALEKTLFGVRRLFESARADLRIGLFDQLFGPATIRGLELFRQGVLSARAVLFNTPQGSSLFSDVREFGGDVIRFGQDFLRSYIPLVTFTSRVGFGLFSQAALGGLQRASELVKDLLVDIAGFSGLDFNVDDEFNEFLSNLSEAQLNALGQEGIANLKFEFSIANALEQAKQFLGTITPQNLFANFLDFFVSQTEVVVSVVSVLINSALKLFLLNAPSVGFQIAVGFLDAINPVAIAGRFVDRLLGRSPVSGFGFTNAAIASELADVGQRAISETFDNAARIFRDPLQSIREQGQRVNRTFEQLKEELLDRGSSLPGNPPGSGIGVDGQDGTQDQFSPQLLGLEALQNNLATVEDRLVVATDRLADAVEESNRIRNRSNELQEENNLLTIGGQGNPSQQLGN